jgi:hypothetical protein
MSMTPGFLTATLPSGKRMPLVDFPGHERQRAAMLPLVRGARGVVLCIDPVEVKGIKAAAQLLFELLASAEFAAATPLLVIEELAARKGGGLRLGHPELCTFLEHRPHTARRLWRTAGPPSGVLYKGGLKGCQGQRAGEGAAAA